MLTPEDFKQAMEGGDMNPDANLLDLRPDPSHFVRFVRSLGRVEMSSELFVRLLRAYGETKSDEDSDPTRYA
jgi:hypothetical protein